MLRLGLGHWTLETPTKNTEWALEQVTALDSDLANTITRSSSFPFLSSPKKFWLFEID
jgi:hypothetical protein